MVKTKLSRALASIIAALTLLISIPLDAGIISEITADAYELSNVTIGAIQTYESGCLQGFNLSFTTPGGASAVSRISVQKHKFKDSYPDSDNSRFQTYGDFTDFGYYAATHSYSDYPDVPADCEFLAWNQSGTFNRTGNTSYPDMYISFDDNIVDLNQNATYYVYMWAKYDGKVYPDCHILTLNSGGGNIWDENTANEVTFDNSTVTGGSITASPANAGPGTTITLTAMAEEGYVFKEWQTTNNNITFANANSATTTFEMPDSDVNITAVFETACTHTNSTHISGVDKTCTTDGSIEYWQCNDCSKKFSNAECTEEVTDITIPMSHEYNNGFCTVCGVYEEPQLVSGIYEIENAGQLYWFADKVNAGETTINGKLMDDIVVNDKVINADGTLVSDVTNLRPWVSMTDYNGTFDGNNHTISGLYVNSTSTNAGLFANTQDSAVVKNLGVIGSYFKGYKFAAGIAGQGKGIIQNCYNMSTVTATYRNAFAAGICAQYSGSGSVENCYNMGNVDMDVAIPYNVVYAFEPECVSNCYYLGTEAGADDEDGFAEFRTEAELESGEVAYLLGSAFGQNIDNGEANQGYPVLGGAEVYTYMIHETCIIDSETTTGYTNTENHENYYPAHQFANYTYNNDETCTENGTNTGTCTVCGESSTVEAPDTALGHDFDSDGFCTVCDGYQPAVLSNGVYQISNAGQLYWFAEKVNGGETDANAKLIKNIAVNENVIVDGQLTATASELREWVPINEYAGTFDGNGHTISGLYMSDYYEYNQNNGLFESIQTNGHVYKLGVTDSYFAGSVDGSITKYAGGIAGYNYGGTIEDCYALNVYFNVTNNSYASAASYNGISNGTAANNCYAVIFNLADKSKNGFNSYSVSDSSYYYLTHLANNNEVVKNVEFADFASGKLTAALNGTRTGSAAVWGQKLTGADKDAYPVFSSNKVYSGYKHGENTITYTNDSTMKLHSDAASEENNNHNSSLDANSIRIAGDDCHAYTCSVCGEEFEKAHDFGNGQYKATSDGAIHYIQCQDCGYRRVHSADMIYTQNSKYHVGACEHEGCNYTVDKEAHEFTRFFKGDAEKHIAVCEECGFVTAKEHNFVNGVCKDCGYEKPLEDTVNITNVTFTVASGKNRVVFEVERDVPVKYTMLEYGIIYSSNGAVTDVESADSLLVKNNVDGTDIKIMKSSNSVNSGKTTIRLIDSGSGVIARPYVLVRNADGQEVYGYGAVAQGNYKELAEKAIKDATRVSIIKVQNDVVVNSKNRVAFSVMRDVKEGYTVIERGIVYSSDGQISSLEQAEEKLYIGNSGVKVMRSASVVPNYGILKVNLTELGNGVYAKGYVVVKDSYGNTATVYSEADYGKNTLESNN